MMSVLVSLLKTLRLSARSRAALQLEVLALRHQLQVLQRSRPRAVAAREDGPLALGPTLKHLDRMANGARDRQALRPSSPGTDAASGCGGPGEAGAA
jgi:hypothetical protein